MAERISASGFPTKLIKNQTTSPRIPTQKPDPYHSHWLGTDWKTDANATIAALGGEKQDLLIIDHYAIERRWEGLLRPHASAIMVIDDLADRAHDCDILLDQNLPPAPDHRYDDLLPENCHRLIGPRYALLQPKYQHLHQTLNLRRQAVRRIFVYFGGADNANLTQKTITALLSVRRNGIEVDVVINSESTFATTIREQTIDIPWITLHEDLPSLAEVMSRADLAIGASGATSLERCCVGLPSLVIVTAENQRQVAPRMHHAGLVRHLGATETVTTDAIEKAVHEVLETEGQLEEWSARCKSLIDGRGAERVADIITLNSSTPLSTRPPSINDESQLLEWANDPIVRRSAFSTSYIAPETHSRWFQTRLLDSSRCKIYIVHTNSGIDIGQVRFDLSDNAWEVSYSIARFARGRRIGSQLVKAAIRSFSKCVRSVQLIARVKPENTPSQRVLERLGFSRVSLGPDQIVYFLQTPEQYTHDEY